MQQDSTALVLQARKHRRRNAILLGLLVFLPCLGLALMIGWKAGVLAALALAYVVYLRAVRTSAVVLWLRKFHHREPGAFPFHRILSRTCLGLAVPITVQDSRFRTSYLLGGARSLLLLPVASLLALPVIAFPPMLIVLALNLKGPVATATFMTLSLLIAVAVGAAIKRFLALRGLLSLSGPDGLKRAEAELERIRKHRHTYAGVRVLKCPDTNWRLVVEMYLDAADAVVLDVSHPTDNLMWELRSARQRLPAESVLLACAVSGQTQAELPPSARVALEGAIGGSELLRHPVFFYPAIETHAERYLYAARARSDARLSDELASRLATCMALSRSPHDLLPRPVATKSDSPDLSLP